jgi:hypothetical protein
MKWILGAIGLIVLGTGAVRAVVSGGQAGVVIIVVAGAVLFLSPFLIDRLESVSAGSASVEVHFTQKVVDLGAPKTAKVLDRTALGGLVESYAFVHQELTSDEFRNARVYLQDLLVARSAALAQTNKLDAREVRLLLAEGPAVVRVLAIGLMTGDPALADAPSIVAAIRDSRSGNEQYHALRLAERRWPTLSTQERNILRETVRTAESSGSIPLDSDRNELAETLLGLPVD